MTLEEFYRKPLDFRAWVISEMDGAKLLEMYDRNGQNWNPLDAERYETRQLIRDELIKRILR